MLTDKRIMIGAVGEPQNISAVMEHLYKMNEGVFLSNAVDVIAGTPNATNVEIFSPYKVPKIVNIRHDSNPTLTPYKTLESIRIAKLELEEEYGEVYGLCVFINADKLRRCEFECKLDKPLAKVLYSYDNVSIIHNEPLFRYKYISENIWMCNSVSYNIVSGLWKSSFYHLSHSHFKEHNHFDELPSWVEPYHINEQNMIGYALYHYINVLGFVNYEQ